MAIVTRYFDASGAGAADGTSWANRAQLHNAGTWSSVLTGFDFSGSDSLLCYINGTHTITSALANATFSVASPKVGNPLFMRGCDSSGNPLTPPDPNWKSCEPDWDTSGLPLLQTTGNIRIMAVDYGINLRLLRFAASGATSNAIVGGANTESGLTIDWCKFTTTTNSVNHPMLSIADGYCDVSNCIFDASGTDNLKCCVALVNVPAIDIHNCRIYGNSGGTTGPGIAITSGNSHNVVQQCTIFNMPGHGFDLNGTLAACGAAVVNCVIANNGGSGINGRSHGSALTRPLFVNRCMLTGNGVYGINAGDGFAYSHLSDNRYRDNTSGATANLGNYDDINGYTTDSDDASEYVDASTTYDFTIKNTATIWGSGYGVLEQAAGGGAPGNTSGGLQC